MTTKKRESKGEKVVRENTNINKSQRTQRRSKRTELNGKQKAELK